MAMDPLQIKQQLGGAAVRLCDKDGDRGLTWSEYMPCQDKYSGLIAATPGMKPLTEEMFKLQDVNHDGIIRSDEWGAKLPKTKEDPWHKSGKWKRRCGKKYPLPNGEPSQCDPSAYATGKGPCCSIIGFCG